MKYWSVVILPYIEGFDNEPFNIFHYRRGSVCKDIHCFNFQNILEAIDYFVEYFDAEVVAVTEANHEMFEDAPDDQCELISYSASIPYNEQ